MTSHNSGFDGFVRAFKRTNPVSTSLIGIFGLLAFVQFGLMSEIIAVIESHSWVPFLGTMSILVVIFLLSGTRDPGHYHPGETMSILSYVGASGVYTFTDVVADYAPAYEWHIAVGMVVFGLAVAAILSR